MYWYKNKHNLGCLHYHIFITNYSFFPSVFFFNLLKIFFFFFSLAAPGGLWACGILVPQPGIEPGPSAVKVRSPNHWKPGNSPLLVLK